MTFLRMSKCTIFVSVPLNAYKLLLPVQGAELQQLALTQTCSENFKNF